MKIITIFSCILNFILFGMSIFYVFRKFNDDGFDIKFYLIKFISPAFWLYGSYVLVSGSYSFYKLLFLLLTNLLASIIFYLASQATKKNKFDIIFSKSAPDKLNMEGPYHWVRHPFYTSYILSYFSLCIVTLNIFLTFMGVVLISTYFIAAKEEESKFLNSEFQDKYFKYKKGTGMFFPLLF